VESTSDKNIVNFITRRVFNDFMLLMYVKYEKRKLNTNLMIILLIASFSKYNTEKTAFQNSKGKYHNAISQIYFFLSL